jgi:UPF0755 protein
MMRKLGIPLVAIAVLAALALLIAPWWIGTSGTSSTHDIVIAPGTTLTGAGKLLEDQGVILSARQFRLLARVFGANAPIKTGTYRFTTGQGWATYLRQLEAGDVVALRVTIPEGMPSIMVAERLRALKKLSGDIADPAEGTILPETYSFAVGSARIAAIDRMQAAMRKTLAELWPRRSAAAVVTSPDQAVILASIVEKETGKASERRLIAGVYSNRLRQGMKLDADPTVIYPATLGKPLGRRILRSELAADTGYNTYLRAGLPKGPITNPGRDSIAAVLDPAQTEALYFVADGHGGHVFADTLAEHQANVAKWYALRRARGDM